MHAVVAGSTLPSQNAQNTRFGALFEIEMSKKCTPLWHEARFEVKSGHDCGVRSIFGRSDVVVRDRRKGIHYPSLHNNYNYATLGYITLHYATLRYITLHYATLRYTTLITLHYITLHYPTLHYIRLHYATLH